MIIEDLFYHVNKTYNISEKDYTLKGLVAPLPGNKEEFTNISFGIYIRVIFSSRHFSSYNQETSTVLVDILGIITRDLKFPSSHKMYKEWKAVKEYCYLIHLEFFDKYEDGRFLKLHI